ncbi:hypothetical protein [Dyella silvatica]|uniref:hypothetical protein n=1 Tax=Dyella silvatica TaxID=2992128 RepID=UPI0022554929|nr:hypothetical protein [Dyella silvatica]
MPRPTQTQITSRPTVESSRSQNVAVPVQASLDHAGRKDSLWVVSNALNSLAARETDALSSKQHRQDAEKAKSDARNGAADAAEAAVTGASPATETLEAQSAVYKQHYYQSEGIRQAGNFENQLLPKLQRLEPGANVDETIQNEANAFVGNSGMTEESRKTFMVTVAKSQDGWKQGYLKQSTAEAIKRDEENHQAILTDAVSKSGALEPQTLQAWRQFGAEKGLPEYELDDMVVKAVVPVLASGKANIDKTLETLSGHYGAGGRVLGDVYREQIDMAAKHGRHIQEEEHKAAQWGDEVTMLDRANQLSERGMYGLKQAAEDGKRFGKSPEWVASMASRSRDANEKAAKGAEKAQRGRNALRLFFNGDPFEIEAFGRKDVEKAGTEVLNQAISSGDMNKVRSIIGSAAFNGAPLPAIKELGDAIDLSNPQRAKKILDVLEVAESISPDYLNKSLSTEAKAKIDRIRKEVRVFGAELPQALTTVKNAERLDSHVVQDRLGRAWKAIKSDIPTRFDDSAIFSGKFRGTPVANAGYVEGYVRDATQRLLETGQYSEPKEAAQSALDLFKANHVQVGDQYVRTYGHERGSKEALGEAMTDIVNSYHEKLVKENRIDKEEKLITMPTPDSPDKWQLYSRTPGGPLPVTEKDEHGNLQQIVVNPSAVLANHSAWKAQEAKKKAVYEQGVRQYDLKHAFGEGSPESLNGYLDRIPKNAIDSYMTGWTGEGLPKALRTPEQRAAAKAFINDPGHKPQGFLDFIHANK